MKKTKKMIILSIASVAIIISGSYVIAANNGPYYCKDIMGYELHEAISNITTYSKSHQGYLFHDLTCVYINNKNKEVYKDVSGNLLVFSKDLKPNSDWKYSSVNSLLVCRPSHVKNSLKCPFYESSK